MTRKGTPNDDEFVLWLAPRLEAAGYKVFADILCLEPGDRWRRVLTSTLQERAAKMLLCCNDVTLKKDGVGEEIGIASDLVRELSDPNFIIPLRLEPFKKVFGIGELQWVDFSDRWADGLNRLLEALQKQNAPCDPENAVISPHWEQYRKRASIEVTNDPETLTSNWLRLIEGPTFIRYYKASGVISRDALRAAVKKFSYPAEVYNQGFFTFANPLDVQEHFGGTGKFAIAFETGLMEFVQEGLEEYDIRRREASNIVMSMLRVAWNRKCKSLGLAEYQWSKASGFHATKDLAPVGKRFGWGRQGDKRSSMLRNIAKGHVWQYGISAQPSFWPYPHMKLKARVLFAEEVNGEAGAAIDDKKKQHRLRRRVCKGWRNKQWHGRQMAMLELMAGDSAYIVLEVGSDASFMLDATPIPFTMPVTTVLPDVLGDEDEETDESTIYASRPEMEDVE
ncbi:MAG: toll/interleukin-1 receptor domain-containing protein [Brevundimonas sp.]|uniref:toll/interleukin-1 receptor domain-containing protein n=1 Tax=Brevundimonas sp. TaxID=1871086 RepID=UPI001A27C745|nr:toll/interleukin-1 receptor domain-containing protein [Brevundimonas sp.]MBJ7319224.1 toll/interleukin-1 receptor domain-containing protein [Brevundimonas sp.]